MKAIIFLISIVLMSSCTIQKRKYMKGWNVQWKNQDISKNENSRNHEEKTINATSISEDQASLNDLSQSMETSPSEIKDEFKKGLLVNTPSQEIALQKENKKSALPSKSKIEKKQLKEIKKTFIGKKTDSTNFKNQGIQKDSKDDVGILTAIAVIIGVVIFVLIMTICISMFQFLGALLAIL